MDLLRRLPVRSVSRVSTLLGVVAEGDVASQMHREVTPLSDFRESWAVRLESGEVFTDLDRYLTQFGR